MAEEITAANVGELEVVWTWEPNEAVLDEYGTQPGPFQATPIMVGDVLYFSTMYTRVVALDAETGAALWTFDPGAYEGGPVGAAGHRQPNSRQKSRKFNGDCTSCCSCRWGVSGSDVPT